MIYNNIMYSSIMYNAILYYNLNNLHWLQRKREKQKTEIEEHENIAFQSCGRYCGTCLKLLLYEAKLSFENAASQFLHFSPCISARAPHPSRVSSRKDDRLFSTIQQILSQLYFHRAFRDFNFFYPLIIYLCFLSIRLAVDFYLRNRLYEQILFIIFYLFISITCLCLKSFYLLCLFVLFLRAILRIVI